MRHQFEQQLETLHNNLIYMGALCEDAIACATKALLDGNAELRERALSLEQDINVMERDIEQLCVRLLLRQQPVASDLRRITAAQKMITDMERIGDQAADIAELSVFMEDSPVKRDVHIADMARATIKMLTDSIDSFVRLDYDQAWAVIRYDDVVDNLFTTVRGELIEVLTKDGSLGGECLDLLMIAKYFERIGDHAENLAEWVLYAITGDRRMEGEEGEAQDDLHSGG
ncbi:MAG: phosphate signaling complex protein PhoU [Oscillospiraceae bacterium]